MKEKITSGVKILLLLGAAGFCLLQPEAVRTAAADGVGRCLTVLIPSLYAMLIVSSLLTYSGILTAAPGFISRPAWLLLGMERTVLPVFTFSMFAGYPVGVKLLAAEYTAGRLSRRKASLLAGICFGAGPAFIFSCAAMQLYGTPAPGRAILVSSVGADVILALAAAPFLRRDTSGEQPFRGVRFSPELLSDAVYSGGRSMAQLCFTVIAFSVLTAGLASCGAMSLAAGVISRITGRDPQTAQTLAAAFMDVTALAELPRGDYTLLPAVSALVSFGGVCVFFQLAAISSGRLSLLPAVVMRTAAAILSYCICRIIAPVQLIGEVTEAAAIEGGMALHRAVSPVPSVMLVLMTLMVMCEWGRAVSRSK